MTSPDPINDLESLDSKLFKDKVAEKPRIMGSPSRKMGNPSTMYNRENPETRPENISKNDDDFELDKL